MILDIFLLLIWFQLKHFLADFPFQNAFMLGKFKERGWFVPLSAHCLVHAGFTIFVSLVYSKNLKLSLALAAADFAIHFVMDRAKASPKMLGRFQSLSKEQFKGLLESRALAMSGVSYDANPSLQAESKRIVADIDKKFKDNTYFWWSLGLDQMVHHLTHYLIIYFLIKGT